MGLVPKNTESYFVSKTMKMLITDWEKETGTKPYCVTSFCDVSYGFNGSIYKATNFELMKVTTGRATNPGKTHGKWKKNNDKQIAQKHFYVYFYNRKPIKGSANFNINQQTHGGRSVSQPAPNPQERTSPC
jgi:hypothetical protein